MKKKITVLCMLFIIAMAAVQMICAADEVMEIQADTDETAAADNSDELYAEIEATAGKYSLASSTLTMYVGDTKSFNVSASYAAGRLDYSSSGAVSASGSIWLDCNTKSISIKASKAGVGYVYFTPVTMFSYSRKEITAKATLKVYVYPAAAKLTAVSNVDSGIKISWNQSSGADSYVVYRKDYGGSSWKRLAVTTSLYYVDKTAAAGSRYTYTVRTYSKSLKMYGGYDSSGLSIARMTKATVKAAAKYNKTYTYAPEGYVYIKWSKVSAASKYIVYRKTAGGKWKRLGTTKNNYAIDKYSSAGTVYYYAVVPYDSVTKTKGLYDSTGAPAVVLSAPSISYKKGSSGVTISCSAVSGADYYCIYRKVSSGKWKRIKILSSDLSYTDTGTSSGKVYYYAVVPYNKTTKSYGNYNYIKVKR